MAQEGRTRRLHLIANSKSGRGSGGSLADLARATCGAAGVELVPYDIGDPLELDAQAEKAVLAAAADGGIVAAAGGDGTIRSVAQHAQGKPVTFAVIPCGTFNYFARAHRIPEDQEQALKLAITGTPRPVRLGQVNGKVFLINASLGLYAKSIREREMATSRWGRRRIVAILAALKTLLEWHHDLDVHLVADQSVTRMRTPMIFIGNNALQLRNLKLSVAQCMRKDLLAVVTMRPLGTWGMLRVIFRGILRTLEREDALDSFCVDSLSIHTRRPAQTLALDGETFIMTQPLQFSALPGALNLVVPAA